MFRAELLKDQLLTRPEMLGMDEIAPPGENALAYPGAGAKRFTALGPGERETVGVIEERKNVEKIF